MSLTFRFPVQGVSKQPPATALGETAMRVTPTEAGAAVAFVSLYSPRIPNGGIVLPNGGLPPTPITPPAAPTRSVVGSPGTIRILLMLRPLKAGALRAIPLLSV